MVIAYVATTDRGCFDALSQEFEKVINLDNIDKFISYYATGGSRDVALVYRVEDMEDLNKLQDIQFKNNIYILVIGEESTELSLYAGKIGVDTYLPISQANPTIVGDMLKSSQSVIKERRGQSNISVFTGISGGVGTTTISMNIANIIAKKNLDKKVLYLDFANTRSISNIFFNRYDKPEKTLIDIAKVDTLDIEEFFANGLTKKSDNFYYIPGIQKHTDREILEKAENLQRFLAFIDYIKNYFEIIIIDVGLFEDSELEIDIQEIADNIYMITELSVPSLAILKTYINIIDRSGWYEKTEIIVNRADSFGTVTEEEAKRAISSGMKHKFEIGFSLPNDARPLRECWNDALLVSDEYPNTKFVTKLDEFISKYFIKNILDSSESNSSSEGDFMSRVKNWIEQWR